MSDKSSKTESNSDIAAEISRKVFEALGNPEILPLTESILTATLTSAFDNYRVYLQESSGDETSPSRFTPEQLRFIRNEMNASLSCGATDPLFQSVYDRAKQMLRSSPLEPTQPPLGCCDGCKMPIGVCRCLEKAMKLAATPEKVAACPYCENGIPRVKNDLHSDGTASWPCSAVNGSRDQEQT